MNRQIDQLIIINFHAILFRNQLSDLHRAAKSLTVLLFDHINEHRIVLIQQLLFHQSSDKIFHINDKSAVIQGIFVQFDLISQLYDLQCRFQNLCGNLHFRNVSIGPALAIWSAINPASSSAILIPVFFSITSMAYWPMANS